MTHLGEKITDFLFEGLSAEEMAEAGRHVAECAECRQQVERFQRTFAMLKASPDVEPPRRIVFEVEKPRLAPWAFRWLGPVAASAAIALAVVSFAPVRGSAEQSAREAEQLRQIEELRGQLAYTENLQRVIWKETIVNSSSIQLLAQNRAPRN